MNKTGLIKT